MAGKFAGKIKLHTVDELLGVPEIAGTMDVDIDRIHPFTNHPFRVVDDDKMESLVESIRENGVLNPVIIRPDDSGNYEMVSGHRRLHACRLAGLTKIPAIVRELTDDEATIVMVDANLQREELLPSEKAFAFKMKMEALTHQGMRTDLASGHNVPRLSSEEIGEEAGMTGRQVKRYIRLTNLIPSLLELVDNKKISFVLGVDISFFDTTIQQWIYEYVKENGFLKPKQIAALKDYGDLNNLNQYSMITILNNALPENRPNGKVSLSEKKLDRYFPPHFSSIQREEVILELLERWSRSQS